MQRELIEIEQAGSGWLIRGGSRAVVCRCLHRAIRIGRQRARRRFRKHGVPVAVAVPIGAERVLVDALG